MTFVTSAARMDGFLGDTILFETGLLELEFVLSVHRRRRGAWDGEYWFMSHCYILGTRSLCLCFGVSILSVALSHLSFLLYFCPG